MGGHFAAVSLIFLTVLAGCAGNTPANAGGAGDGVPVEVEPGLVIDSTRGAIRGTVHADTGLVLPDARVNVVASEHSATSNATGAFLFANVTPGTHRLRIEATGFRAYEGEVKVEASKVVQVHPTLVAADSDAGDYRSHLHDYWGTDKQVVLVDDEFAMDEFRVRTPTAESSTFSNQVFASVVYANTVFSGLRYRVPLPESADRPPLVYGGTERIEVTFTWNNAPPGVPTYAFGYETAANTDLVLLEEHAPGHPWSVSVKPEETDNGHQAFSLWNFYVVPVNQAQAAPDYRPAVAIDPIRVKITVFKGNDPTPEPAHPEFWKGGDRLVVRDSTNATYTVNANVWAVQQFGLARGVLVPPGTKWLDIDLLWKYTDAAPANPAPPSYMLYYNPGNEHWDRFTEDWKSVMPASTPAPGHLKFNITLEAGEADGFYQHFSLWKWKVRNVDNPTGEDGLPQDFYRSRSYQLLVTAIKDPAVGIK